MPLDFSALVGSIKSTLQQQSLWSLATGGEAYYGDSALTLQRRFMVLGVALASASAIACLYIGSFIAARGAAAGASVVTAWALGAALHLCIFRPLLVHAHVAAVFFGWYDWARAAALPDGGLLRACLPPSLFPGPVGALEAVNTHALSLWLPALALPLAARETGPDSAHFSPDQALLALAPLGVLARAWDQPHPTLASLRLALQLRAFAAARRVWAHEAAAQQRAAPTATLAASLKQVMRSGSGSGSGGGGAAASAAGDTHPGAPNGEDALSSLPSTALTTNPDFARTAMSGAAESGALPTNFPPMPHRGGLNLAAPGVPLAGGSGGLQLRRKEGSLLLGAGAAVLGMLRASKAMGKLPPLKPPPRAAMPQMAPFPTLPSAPQPRMSSSAEEE